MTRDNIVFTTCGFLLGLVIGGLVIGPRLAESKLAGAAGASSSGMSSGAAAPDASAAPPSAVPPSAAPPGAATAGGNAGAMDAVRQQLAALKATIERDPKNAGALMQLGNMYMDAAKYPQAIEYYERGLALRDDPAVRTDLGICYKQAGQLDKAVAAFHKAGETAPDQWQAMFNEAIVLGEMKRFDEARAVAAKLNQMRPNDPQVQKLVVALAGKS
jgi:tetratricopeptide (TPR) repeat protein